MMDEHGKSDSPVVPEKSSNKVPKGAAEAMEACQGESAQG
jgi:hypothetical protein